MKKLSALIAMILCVIVGGVYANWVYAEGEDTTDAYNEVTVTLSQATSDQAKGIFGIETNFTIQIDQLNDDHDAVLKFVPNVVGEAVKMKITFTPSASASDDVKKNGIPARYYLDTTTTMQYKMDSDGNYNATGTAYDVFILSPTHGDSFAENVDWEYDAVNKIFYMEFDEAALSQMIKLNTPNGKVFRLDTKAEYDAFHKALNGNIEFNLTDGKHTDDDHGTTGGESA